MHLMFSMTPAAILNWWRFQFANALLVCVKIFNNSYILLLVLKLYFMKITDMAATDLSLYIIKIL